MIAMYDHWNSEQQKLSTLEIYLRRPFPLSFAEGNSSQLLEGDHMRHVSWIVQNAPA